MALVGVLYLVFEKNILAKTKLQGDSTAPADDLLSRSLIGFQVCLLVVNTSFLILITDRLG